MTASKSTNKANRKRAVSKKTKENKFGFVRTLIVFVIVAVILIPVWNNMISINKKDEEIVTLTQERNTRKIRNDALEQKVEDPTDDEYIADIARENGYRMGDEILFYLSPGD